MTQTTCDKGPVLDKLLDTVYELKSDQKKVVDALIDLAHHQERIVSLADKTADNKKDIDTLYQLQRETEAGILDTARSLDQRFTSHLMNHPSPDTCSIRTRPGLLSPDSKFDKVQVAVILSMLYFMASQLWGLITNTLQTLKNIGGPA